MISYHARRLAPFSLQLSNCVHRHACVLMRARTDLLACTKEWSILEKDLVSVVDPLFLFPISTLLSWSRGM